MLKPKRAMLSKPRRPRKLKVIKPSKTDMVPDKGWANSDIEQSYTKI